MKTNPLTWLNALLLSSAALLMFLPMAGIIKPLLALDSIAGAETGPLFSLTTRQLGLLGKSVLFSAVVAASTSAIGAIVALMLMRSRGGSRVISFVLPGLITVPPAIHGLNWTATILSAGPWLVDYGLQPRGWLAAGLTEVLSYLPVAVAVAWAGFRLLDTRLTEAGLIYRSVPAVMTAITVRLAMPVLLTGTGVMFLLSLSDYSVPSLFSVNVYALEIYSTYSTGINPAAAVFTALPLVALIALTLAFVLRSARRSQGMAMHSSVTVKALPNIDMSGTAVVVGLLVYFCLPLSYMALTASQAGTFASAVSGAATEFFVSLAVSLSSAALCLVLGLSVGKALDRKGPLSSTMWALTCLAFALPAPLVGIGILQLGVFGEWAEDLLPVWASTVRFLPIAAFVWYAMHRRLNYGLIEAGRVFARSRPGVFARITLPLMLPGVVISAAACFAFSIGELGASLLVASPGHATLMMRLYNLLHYGASAEVAALCLMLTLPGLVAGLLLTTVLHSRSASTNKEQGNA